MPNDDLDLQLIWMKAVQERGPLSITSAVLGEYWLNYIPAPWNEYGINKSNQRVGLAPPISGMYNNPWKNSNGAWIRSEIWACLTPGCPDSAIRLAYSDASVDHGGAEGMYAEMFTAALQSAAFLVHDREELISIGLSKIPPDCRVARSIGIALQAYPDGESWQVARKRIVEDSVDLGWFMAPANVAFVIVGWLFGGGDFGKSLLITTNCGDDTDCTAATLGALMGILLGREGIPVEWSKHLGDRILTVAIDRGSYQNCPETLGQLTDQVMEQIPAALIAFHCPVRITEGPSDITSLSIPSLKDGEAARTIWAKSSYGVEYDFVHTHVIVDYGKDPEARAGEAYEMKVTMRNLMPDARHLALTWRLPAGWLVSPSLSVSASLLQGQERVLTFQITPDHLDEPSYRGILEIVAQGRPTVGLVPLLFLNAAV